MCASVVVVVVVAAAAARRMFHCLCPHIHLMYTRRQRVSKLLCECSCRGRSGEEGGGVVDSAGMGLDTVGVCGGRTVG